jgi:hypothetical protein
MRKTAFLLLSVISIAIVSVFVYNYNGKKQSSHKNKFSLSGLPEKEKEEGGYKRRMYEWKLLHDPATGQIPKGIYQKEREILASVIKRQSAVNFRPSILNNYTAAGPTQNGGRTRAVAYDMRNNNVMLAAGISGGIFRSTNGGATWSYVSVDTSLMRNVNCFAQDPRPAFNDTWYAGTGEILGGSAGYPNSSVASGNGILKSTNNGVTWSKVSITAGSTYKENLDNIFDMIFNIQVDNRGYVYFATFNYIWISTDGFQSPNNNTFGYILGIDDTNQTLEAMATDIAISKDGTRYYASFSGRNNNRDTVGVWASTDGLSDWKRIAGGRNGQPDSVAGWKAYNPSLTNGTGWGRTVLAVAPNNANNLYVMYENSLSASSGQSEADLFQANLGTFSNVTWSSNRSSNLRALQNGSTTKHMETQEGYNMLLAVHPTNQNLVLAGGVNLFKSTDGFSTQTATFIGGLESPSTYDDPQSISHVDYHSFAFQPNSPNRMVVGNDGGLQVTNDITASKILWENLNNQYQTFQYYHVAIDPTAASLTFAGGAQDNSTSYRDSKALLGPALSDPNDHYVGILGGDGGMTALSPSTNNQQFLYASAQNGIMARFDLGGPTPDAQIDPSGAPEGEFVTYYHLDPDNTELMYYAAGDRLWRTSSASTVTPTTGWTEMTGIATTLNESIFSLATSRGTYSNSGSYLFIGTADAKIYRIQDPRNAAASTTPVNITPSGITANSLVREIAVNPRNPDTVLAVVSNYGAVSAFWTGNALSASPTWQVVEGTKINLASFRSCAIVATTTGVEYYVGTSIGLFSTTTISGASTNWQLEGPAMMQGAIVNDLVLRTADNTLLVGTHGNGMFYTTIGNVPTSVPDVVVNDKRFINAVFPTITPGDINFRTGGATGIKTIHIRVTNLSGQVLIQRTQAYQNGTVPLGPLSTGSYLLEIISDNRRYKHVQQFVKTN